MKKNIVRLLVLGALIILCIWQTVTLWLGDMSSHNFFATVGQNTYEEYYVYPKQIWAMNRFAYNIGGANSEEGRRYRLVAELTNELKRDNVQITNDVKLKYENLLSTQGIVYEYGTPLTIEEITGKEFKIENKVVNSSIQALFIDLSSSDNYKAYVYLVDDEGNVNYMLTINNKLYAHVDTLNYFTGDDHKMQLEKYQNYQASLLYNYNSEYFKGNVFYPVSDQNSPISYESVLFRPTIMEGDEHTLENMVNSLFTNPNYKQPQRTETGITYSDNLNLTVKYDNVGTLEFMKSVSENSEKLSPSQKMNKVCNFIKDTTAIPESLKQGLYLKGIEYDQVSGESTYSFGYEFDNTDVVIDKQIKEKLKLNAFVELTIKNDVIVRGKWLMRTPEVINNEKGTLIKEYDEVMNDIFNGSKAKNGKLSNLECAYILNDLDNVIDFNWVYF